MMKTRTAFALLALPMLALAAGCDETPSGPAAGEFDFQTGHALLNGQTEVRLSAAAEAFTPGASVTLMLENQSGAQIGYNLCFHALERRGGSEWSPVGEGQICTTQLHLLAHGSTAQYSTSLPTSLAPGEYRYRAPLYLMDQEDQRDQVTESFQVGD